MTFSSVVSRYVSHKRALGYRYRNEEAVLRAFCKTVGDSPIANVKAEDVLNYLNGKGQITESWAKKHRVLSGLYHFAQTRAMVEGCPLPRTIPKPTVPPFVPYIYSCEELKALFDAVPFACAGRAAIEEAVFRTLLLLLYGAGLRIAEALALTLGDVNLREAYLRVRGTKFFKSRLVPLGKDLTGALSRYAVSRQERHGSGEEAPLFCLRDGSPLSQSAARNAFRRLRAHAGVRREGGARRQPRLHDLRHTSAVHRLIEWYRSGADVQKLLPKLATYLGHVDLSGTQRYLTLTPELLRQASQRFESYALEGEHD
jgi:site-specific recombinase XerD